MSDSPASGSEAQPGERLSVLERFLQSDPGNPHLFRECAGLALQVGAFDVLARVADTRLRSIPGDALASAMRSRALIATRDYRAAAEILQRLTKEDAGDRALQQDLGLCYFCLGDYERARAPLEAVYREGERSSGLLRLLVSTYHHLGRLPEAISLASENAAPARADAALAGGYALLYLDGSRPADAARWARTALSLNPQSVDALTVEGTLSVARGDPEKARTCFESALAHAPQTGRAWIGLGSLALLRQDLPKAIELLSRGVELMPGHVGSWHVLAWAHLLADDLANAERAFVRALELDRNFAETHGGLAAVAALQGDVPAAQRAMETALKLDPTCLSAQFTRSVLAGRGGDTKLAREIVLGALGRLTANPTMAFARNLVPPSKHH